MTPPRELVLPSSLDGLGDARAWIAAHAEAAGFAGTDVLDLELVVTEAVSNVVRHAYGGAPGRDVRLDAAVENGDLVIRIRDSGEPFAGPDPLAERGEGGYGLGLIAQLVDSIGRTTTAEGNMLELTKHLTGGRS
ncbi:MAG: ATP-binding protein [Gaiellaceae bacterium]